MMPHHDTNAPGLVLTSLTVTRAGKALFDISATIPPGAVTTIMGPSGIGKSTLLAAVGGFLDPAFRMSGRVILNGRDVTGLSPQARRMGLLFQDDLLFPHLSAGENVAFALPSTVKGRKARRARADALLDEVGLADMADRDPATLSGGQRARVALARVLAAEPEALLLDEPFSKLDTDLRARMRALVFGEARAKGLPVLLVTHDGEDAAAAGGPVLEL